MINSRNGHNELGIGDNLFITFHIRKKKRQCVSRCHLMSSENVYWGPQRNLLIYYTLTFSLNLVDETPWNKRWEDTQWNLK